MKCFLLLSCFLVSTVLFAQPKTTFMPENNLHLQDGMFDNGMTEETFNAVIDEVETYYKPIISGHGADLIIERNWKDATVNAYASQSGSTWTIAMFGGLARRPEVTPDGFAMVVCHEMGHHLGGFPFVSGWAAAEGTSDYFAMHACAKALWAHSENTTEQIDSVARELCDTNLDPNQDRALCYREMNAGYSLANLLGALGGTKVSFSTPDKSIVKRTYSSHPKAQCRLDTYVAGTLCGLKWDDAVIPQTEAESSKYVCTNKSVDGYDIQARPRCWFKPSK